MVLSYDPQIREAVICSAWGKETDWIRNIRARPALQVQIGREDFTPDQRFLTQDERMAVVAEFLRRYRYRALLIGAILGWGDLHHEATARDFVRSRPFVALRPALVQP